MSANEDEDAESPARNIARRIAIYKASSHPKPHIHPLTPVVHRGTLTAAPTMGSDEPMNPTRQEDPTQQHVVRDRFELIQRIKRGESPTWSPPSAVQQQQEDEDEQLASPSEIERPRSALHRGDFTHQQQHIRPSSRESNPLNWSPVALQVPSQVRSPSPISVPTLRPGPSPVIPSGTQVVRPRLSSLSSTYIPRSPTSPLFRSSLPSDYESIESAHSIAVPRPLPGLVRRSTASLGSPGFSPTSPSRAYDPSLYPYGASRPLIPHQRAASNPSSYVPSRSRRLSFAANATPERLSTLVGSYEESILRGRMSSQASNPLSFNAKIGVLGRGECKSRLRCPPHVEVDFPAVFYKYSALGEGSRDNSEPSPYVGMVDLENDLPEPARQERAKRGSRTSRRSDTFGDVMSLRSIGESTPSITDPIQQSRRSTKQPKAPPGGSYAIPPEGQLQIVIKNPNKSAVKLFLIPYNVRDMNVGEKTFVRYRAFSSGPIVEQPLSSSAFDPGHALSVGNLQKPILRYLLHLHICCPSQGHYYLYKSIRIVFANRVPDGKEKLKEDISHPDPRYSTYRAERTMLQNLDTSTQYEPSHRRRTYGGVLPQHRLDTADGIGEFSTSGFEVPRLHHRSVSTTSYDKVPPPNAMGNNDIFPSGYGQELARHSLSSTKLPDFQRDKPMRPEPDPSPTRSTIDGVRRVASSDLSLTSISSHKTDLSLEDARPMQFRRLPEEQKGRPFTPPGLRDGESLLTRRFRGSS